MRKSNMHLFSMRSIDIYTTFGIPYGKMRKEKKELQYSDSKKIDSSRQHCTIVSYFSFKLKSIEHDFYMSKFVINTYQMF